MTRIKREDKRYIVGNQIDKYKIIYLLVISLVALFECVLFIRGLLIFDFNKPKHCIYLFSYVFLLIFSLFAATMIFIGKQKKFSPKTYSAISYVYSIAILVWSLTISYLDMQAGNAPIVYLTVVVTIAGIVVLEPEFFLTSLLLSFVTLIGLDSMDGFNFFVSSSEFINYSVFIAMAGIISCRHFYVTYKEFKAQEILEKSVLDERNRVSTISLQTIMSISNAVDAKDKYTREHSQRVAEYSVVIAKKLNWEKERIEELHKIALLHDIGKIGVPDSILNNTGTLNKEEFELMKTHTTIGGEILKDLTILKNVDLGVKFHHERYDGTGYPSGLKGEDIPIEARIIAVADAFDAMHSNRVYRKKLSNDKIINELNEGKGTQFDPILIDAFLPFVRELLEKEKE